ncbi:hypothetical protein BN871_BR_00040 [Paenibacillus sp. P22]|nr:hypothetical protein BN871_BR_00040 [Paenibacillus sp. P22]
MLGGDSIPGIGHLQLNLVMLLHQLDVDGAFFVGVFHGVVQQDHDDLADLLAAADGSQAGLNLIREFQVLFVDDRLHRQNDAFHRFAQVERNLEHPVAGILHLGQVQQVVRQRLHALGFRLDVMQPLGLSGDRVVAVREQHVGVGVDDGQRRLQLVRGIGDEALLLVERLPHRSDGAACEVPAHKIDDGEHDESDQRERVDHRGENFLLGGHVQVNDGIAFRGTLRAVSPVGAVERKAAVLDRIRDGALLGQLIELVVHVEARVLGQQVPLRIRPQSERDGALGRRIHSSAATAARRRLHAAAGAALAALAGTSLMKEIGDAPELHVDVMACILIGDRVDGPEGDEHDDRDDHHVHHQEPVAQPIEDHSVASSTYPTPRIVLMRTDASRNASFFLRNETYTSTLLCSASESKPHSFSIICSLDVTADLRVMSSSSSSLSLRMSLSSLPWQESLSVEVFSSILPNRSPSSGTTSPLRRSAARMRASSSSVLNGLAM